MFPGYNTNGFAHHPLETAIPLLSELGYRGVAITLDYHSLNPYDPALPGQIDRVRDLLQRHRLACVVETGARFLLDARRKHYPTLVDPAPLAGPRVDFLRRSIEIAQALGAGCVSLWSGQASDGVDFDAALERLVPPLRGLCDFAAERGVRLAFEPEPGMAVDTMPRFRRLIDALPHPALGLTLDVGHLQCQGELPLGEVIRGHGERLWNVHLEDMRSGAHDHLMFGEGEIDFEEVFDALRAVQYASGVYVELSRHSFDAVRTAQKSRAFLERFLGGPGPAAENG